MEEAGHEQAEPSFFPRVGQEVGDAIAASAGLGGASVTAGRTSCSPPPQGDLREGCVLTVGTTHSESKMSFWWTAMGATRIFRRASSAPATAQVQDSGGLAGAGLSACWSSPRESRCPRGGIAWAGVLAASATA